MQGTIVCGVTDTNDGRQALAAAVELTERLGLRLVLAHVAEGVASLDGDGDGSVTMNGGREGAERLLAHSQPSARCRTAPNAAWPSVMSPRSWDRSPLRRPPT